MNARTSTRFARTLDEAFRTPRYADPIERPEPRKYPRTLWVVLAVGFIAAVAL